MILCLNHFLNCVFSGGWSGASLLCSVLVMLSSANSLRGCYLQTIVVLTILDSFSYLMTLASAPTDMLSDGKDSKCPWSFSDSNVYLKFHHRQDACFSCGIESFIILWICPSIPSLLSVTFFHHK